MEKGSTLRILVVDDEPSQCELVQQVLLGRGYACETAPDALEAMNILCRQPFDLVISDIRMHGQDGLALMREAKEKHPHLHFIIMTGYAPEYLYGDIIEAGAADFISKPLSLGELKAKVKRIERERLTTRELRETNDALFWETSANAAAADLAQALLSASSIDEISHVMLEHSLHLTGSKIGYVAYIDPGTGNLVCPTMTSDLRELRLVPDMDIVSGESSGPWGWMWGHGEPVLANNPGEDPRSTGIPDGLLSIDRFISVPSTVGNALVGQLALANSDRDYTQRDLALLKRFADLYAIALQKAHNADELTKYREHLEVLVEERAAGLLDANACLEQEIVERKRMEGILKRSEGQVRLLNENILNMLMIMSHDIRGPLVAMGANLKLLLRGVYGQMDESVRNTLEDLLKRVARLLGSAEDCLGKAHAVEGSLKFSREMLDLRQDIIDVILEEVSTDIQQCCITIDNRLGAIPAGSIIIKANKIWLKTVFRNLFKNAIKYGGRGCTIAFGFEDRVNHYRLNVFNTGRPIPEEDRDKLFTKFGRLQNNAISPTEGIGLGLYLIREIIRKHGGDIWYEAKPDGSDFVFTLPR